jgi:hypothetical protein
MVSQRLDERDNYVILMSNSEVLLKYICSDSCEGLTITTVGLTNFFFTIILILIFSSIRPLVQR